MNASNWKAASAYLAGILTIVGGNVVFDEVKETKLAQAAWRTLGLERNNPEMARTAKPQGPQHTQSKSTIKASATSATQIKSGAVASLVATANSTAGKMLFKRCAACHTIGKGGAKRIGPNLWGIVGAKIAGVSGYRYSNALKKRNGIWTYENLDAFLKAPRKFANGTRMSFVGLRNAKDRANLIAYMRDHADTKHPLQ